MDLRRELLTNLLAATRALLPAGQALATPQWLHTQPLRRRSRPWYTRQSPPTPTATPSPSGSTGKRRRVTSTPCISRAAGHGGARRTASIRPITVVLARRRALFAAHARSSSCGSPTATAASDPFLRSGRARPAGAWRPAIDHGRGCPGIARSRRAAPTAASSSSPFTRGHVALEPQAVPSATWGALVVVGFRSAPSRASRSTDGSAVAVAGRSPASGPLPPAHGRWGAPEPVSPPSAPGRPRRPPPLVLHRLVSFSRIGQVYLPRRRPQHRPLPGRRSDPPSLPSRSRCSGFPPPRSPPRTWPRRAARR